MGTKLYLPRYFATEHELCGLIKDLTRSKCQKIAPVVSSDMDENQAGAVVKACENSLSILTGMPGTGKTKTIGQVVKSFDEAGMKGISVCPTAQAKKRVQKTLRDTQKECAFNNPPECLTTHRALGYQPQTGKLKFNEKNKLPYDYIHMDEGSMQDIFWMTHLFRAIDIKRTRLVISGDPKQLPSVDPGKVMDDMINCGKIPVTILQKIYRQGANSGICHNAKAVLSGGPLINKDPVTGEKFTDMFFIDRGPEETLPYIQHVIQGLRSNGVNASRDIQILAPGKKGCCGTVEINKVMRDILNPDGPGKRKLNGMRVGDRVINRMNDLKLNIVNGDVGIIKGVTGNSYEVEFEEGSGPDEDGMCIMTEKEAAYLHHAYCFTVHSSQGNEFPIVIMPIHKMHWTLLYRNMLYTGMTRARTKCILVGEPVALSRCLRNEVVDRRVTRLSDMLSSALSACC